MGNNLHLLNNYGVVDILETELEFISYLNKTHGQFINYPSFIFNTLV